MRPPTARIVLSDGAVTLRKYREEDAESVFLAVRESLNEISPWMPWCHQKYSLEDSRVWSASRDVAWANGLEYDFVITSGVEDLPLGVCGLNHFDNEVRMANMGYWVRTGKTNRGVATSAAILLSRFGFEELELHRIWAMTHPDNARSIRVLERAGFKREGHLRDYYIDRGRFVDRLIYALLEGDWR